MDASLGGHVIAEALRARGADVITHDERFEPGTPDETWLSEAGRQGWIVLSKDRKIRYNEVERRAIMAFRVGAFFLTSGNLTGKQMAEAFVKALPRIYRISENREKPFIATIYRSGRVTIRF